MFAIAVTDADADALQASIQHSAVLDFPLPAMQTETDWQSTLYIVIAQRR
jgi:hypothetical protein